MSKVGVALLSAIVVGLMLVPSGVSARSMMLYATDSTGDICMGWDVKTGGLAPGPPGAPWATTGYLDIAAAWLSQKGNTYTFGMELAAALPKEGAALCKGVQQVEWAMWIDPSPFNYATNPVAALFKMALTYDGSTYSAGLWDLSTGVFVTSLPFTVSGATLQFEFSAASIGNFAFSWWVPLVRIWQGLYGSAGYAFLDGIDWNSVEGQVYHDLPWPPA